MRDKGMFHSQNFLEFRTASWLSGQLSVNTANLWTCFKCLSEDFVVQNMVYLGKFPM